MKPQHTLTLMVIAKVIAIILATSICLAMLLIGKYLNETTKNDNKNKIAAILIENNVDPKVSKQILAVLEYSDYSVTLIVDPI